MCDRAREHAARTGSIDAGAFLDGAGQRCNVTFAGFIINRKGTGTMAQTLAGARTSWIHQGRHDPAPTTYPDLFEHNTIRNQAVGEAGPQT